MKLKTYAKNKVSYVIKFFKFDPRRATIAKIWVNKYGNRGTAAVLTYGKVGLLKLAVFLLAFFTLII